MKIMKLSVAFTPLILAMVVAGCASKPPAEVTPDSEAYARKIILEKGGCSYFSAA
jgi:PBP1b-binding outer membrane lipoprotein LpoB